MTRLDRQDFDQLVQQHHAAVYRSALRIAGRADVAGDVVQDVFLRALQGKVDLAAASSPRAVLCWLATRLGRNAIRAGRRRQDHEEHAAMQRTDDHRAFHDSSDAAADLGDAVRRHVAALPDELRLPLQLRYEDELTFAAVGSALAIGESTAHDRVQRALRTLRARLGSAGFAVAAVDLEAALAAPSVVAAPPTLLPRLLALPRWKALLPAGKAAVLAIATTLCIAAVLVAASAGGGSAGQAPAAALADVAAAREAAEGTVAAQEPQRIPVPPPPGAAAAKAAPQDPATHVTFAGTVRDAEGQPSPQLRVEAVAAGGLKPFELAATTTAADGAFSLQVPRQGKVPARTIRIVVRQHRRELVTTGELDLRADGERERLDLRLPRAAGLERERFELTVVVRDAGGRPVADVPVSLYEKAEPPPRPGQTASAAEATTDAGGIALLVGRVPGEQLLLVDARKQGFTAVVDDVAVAAASARRHEVTVAAGAELRAQLETVDGGLLQWANVWLVDEQTQLYHSAALQPDGSVRFERLGDGPFTLHVTAHPWSPVRRGGLRPGGEPVRLRLKASDDERDVGDHMAEIHGRLVDADGGEVVAYEPFDVEVAPVLPGDSTLALDRLQPPRPVQRMSDGKKRDSFHLVGLEAGEHGIVARVRGHAVATAIVSLRAGELRSGFELRLQRPATVEGRVLGADGAPVAGARVTVLGLGERADRNLQALAEAARTGARELPARLCCSVQTDAAGAFSLQGLPPFVQLRVVGVIAGGQAASTPFALQPGERRAGIELKLK